jgi:BlaI family transcriptional regulator, penicillinase repressor
MSHPLSELGRRERQIMDILFRRGRATAAEVLEDLADPPSYSSVRGMLRLLEDKGYVSHRWDGPRHVFQPTADPRLTGRSAARDLMRTFFDNSMEAAVEALLGAGDRPPTEEELNRLSRLIAARRKGGRR